MTFRFKNMGATYQREMVSFFHHIIHDYIEAYVDDIIYKSREKYDHILDIRKIFQRMREYKMKLNPKKCTFGISSSKFLGFIISRRGIEVDPKKFSTIIYVTPP